MASQEPRHTYQVLSSEEIRRRKNAKRGIQFCIMVIGETGSGKTTFLNNLCNRQIFVEDEPIDPSKAHMNPGLEIFTHQVQLHEENSTPISLDIILAPGLGDNIDNSRIPGQVVKYLETQFDSVLNEEIRIKRNTRIMDTRPHACLYFIRATSRGLREFDTQLMKELCTKVNIIPIISKADLFTEQELVLNKKLIMRDIKANNIKIYDFANDKLEDTLVPIDDNPVNIEKYDTEKGTTGFNTYGRSVIDDSNYVNEVNSATRIQDMLPFAIVSSNKKKQYPNGEVYHVREYPWGDVRIEDRTHSDFVYLKSILLGSHLQDLKDTTHDVLYENYRTEKLMSRNPTVSADNGGQDSTMMSFTLNGDDVSSVNNAMNNAALNLNHNSLYSVSHSRGINVHEEEEHDFSPVNNIGHDDSGHNGHNMPNSHGHGSRSQSSAFTNDYAGMEDFQLKSQLQKARGQSYAADVDYINQEKGLAI
ncbi:HHR202Wp [Eremothecium sinecaudum]|uniref:HHR202Wp n=1 Tax=Eremothecium sinecaudum TaxID=45286 RepID=A0A0X8HWU9_9SACH|nr:HHR202Wp [Eremothecium sinecaudum]AMD22971.1 HHR202Wp [Eremothecium sinecaudum]